MRFCPKCQSDSKVIDMRTLESGSNRRRRECVQCEWRWSSIEITDEEYNRVMKLSAAFNVLKELL